MIGLFRAGDGKRAVHILLVAGLLAVPLSGAGCSLLRRTPPGNAAAGKILYEANCTSCHGRDAAGLPGLGKSLIDCAFCRRQSDAQLVEFIKRGRAVTDPADTTHVPMPPKGGNLALTDAQLRDIVAYLRSIDGGAPHRD